MNPMERIAEALERMANAQEALVLLAQAILSDGEAPEVPAGVPQLLMTQDGPIELR
jgi:hypothetical protein